MSLSCLMTTSVEYTFSILGIHFIGKLTCMESLHVLLMCITGNICNYRIISVLNKHKTVHCKGQSKLKMPGP